MASDHLRVDDHAQVAGVGGEHVVAADVEHQWRVVAAPAERAVDAQDAFARLDAACDARGAIGQRVQADVAQIGRAHSELQSLMRLSYAVFCLKKKKKKNVTK